MPEEKQKKKYTYQRVSETYNGIRYSARGKSVAEAYRKLQKKIDAARKAFREGKCISLNSHEEIDAYFERL